MGHNLLMAWAVVLHPDFDPEFDALAPEVQERRTHASISTSIG